jgi:hypothetical protein
MTLWCRTKSFLCTYSNSDNKNLSSHISVTVCETAKFPELASMSVLHVTWGRWCRVRWRLWRVVLQVMGLQLVYVR